MWHNLPHIVRYCAGKNEILLPLYCAVTSVSESGGTRIGDSFQWHWGRGSEGYWALGKLAGFVGVGLGLIELWVVK